MEGRLKGHIDALGSQLSSGIDAVEKRLMASMDERFAAFETRILEKTQEMVRDAQTEILRGFLPFQESFNVRFRKLESISPIWMPP